MRWDSLAGARSDSATVMCRAVTRKLRIITIILSTQGSARNNNISHLNKRPKWNPNNRSSCSKNLPPPAVNILLPNREANESGPAQIPRHQFLLGSVSRQLDLRAICTLNSQRLIACKKSALMGKREVSLPAPSTWRSDYRMRLPWITMGIRRWEDHNSVGCEALVLRKHWLGGVSISLQAVFCEAQAPHDSHWVQVRQSREPVSLLRLWGQLTLMMVSRHPGNVGSTSLSGGLFTCLDPEATPLRP